MINSQAAVTQDLGNLASRRTYELRPLPASTTRMEEDDRQAATSASPRQGQARWHGPELGSGGRHQAVGRPYSVPDATGDGKTDIRNRVINAIEQND